MKKFFVGFWYSMPIQIFFLHFRKFQVFLIFWYILFATINGHFLEKYGAIALYLSPEYFNTVNALSAMFVGISVGVYIMSWNITTFILHNKYFQFLATTSQPFLKYCINNAIIPFVFLLNYIFQIIHFNYYRELMPIAQIIWLLVGFLGGLFFAIAFAFAYFFGADKTIYLQLGNAIKNANKLYNNTIKNIVLQSQGQSLRIDWFLSARLKLRKPRDVRHYTQSFLDDVLKKHHFAAVLAFFVAFIALIAIGYTSDARLSQIPAAASITVFFALIFAVMGALWVFLKNWSFLVVVLVYLLFNILYVKEIIDSRTAVFGLHYDTHLQQKPLYNKASIIALANVTNIEKDKLQFIKRLEAWKKQQPTHKPIAYIINTSGGGLRSAAFTFRTLQYLDSVMNGTLLQQTILINGASGGMLGAAYFRALYQQKLNNKFINLQNNQYVDDISKDLLNPIFASFVTRDLIAPIQQFTVDDNIYVKDRAYAFEEKLNENTGGLLDKNIEADKQAEDNATIPTMLYNSVITRDGRKMIFCSQPVRFLMSGSNNYSNIIAKDPDAIDGYSFFEKQNANKIKITSALRINATFPYVLPNAALPTNPSIDVMDAGLRDNFGQENSLRFIEVFKEWLLKNTQKVVMIQIRDRAVDDWEKPTESKSLIDLFTNPAFLLHNNWFKMQDYEQNNQLNYMANNYQQHLLKITFQYVPTNQDAAASLSFHLTAREKKEIAGALSNAVNTIPKNQLHQLITIK